MSHGMDIVYIIHDQYNEPVMKVLVCHKKEHVYAPFVTNITRL